jgi:Fic family protein
LSEALANILVANSGCALLENPVDGQGNPILHPLADGEQAVWLAGRRGRGRGSEGLTEEDADTMPTYTPRFTYTTEMVRRLMEIEAACRTVDVLVLPPDSAFQLWYEARRRSTHYSTSIEGNPLTLDQVQEAIAATDRDGTAAQQELRNYWMALEWLERQVEEGTQVTEEFIRRLHRIIIVRGPGRRGEMSEYRANECPVWDSVTGAVEYGPPTPADVPGLVRELVAWRLSPEAEALPVPLRAGIMAYRFVSIHPFGDGNGRTARALATAELWLGGYGMRGFLSVEEYYSVDRARYYASLQMGLPVDYYEGRNDPDMTPWLTYFTETLARAASAVCDRAVSLHQAMHRSRPLWEDLNRPQQQLLSRLVVESPGTRLPPTFTPGDLEQWFLISRRTAQVWLHQWQTRGLVEPAGTGQMRVRLWQLAKPYRDLVAEVRKAGVQQK